MDLAFTLMCEQSDPRSLVRDVAAAKEWAEARFTHLALCQIGGASQPGFNEWAAAELLPALRKAELA